VWGHCPKNGILTAMSAGDFSGINLSMGCDGELGIGSIRIAANAHVLTTFFCSCQPMSPSMAKIWAGQRVVIPWTTRRTVDGGRQVRPPMAPS